MKKLFTLVLGLGMLVGANAQGTRYEISQSQLPANKSTFTKPNAKQIANSDSRAQVVPMVLDYDGVDENYAVQVSSGTMVRYSWQVNSRFPADSFATFHYAVAVFDSLVNANPNTGEVITFPKAAASFTLDSLAIPYIHRNTSGQNDTIKITVYNRTGLVIPTPLTTGNVSGTSLWDTTIITNTSLNDDQTFSKEFLVYPNLNFAAGNTFAVRFDYTGPIQDEMLILVSYRDDCSAECIAAPAAAGENAIVKANMQGPNTLLFTGDGVVVDCNDDNIQDPCEWYYFQNIVFFPFITATVQYGATISADIPAACPNEVVTLTANGFGTEDLPLDYAWSTTNGTLTSNSGQQVSLVTGSANAVVTVTVTDANNVTTSSTFTVTSRAINITFTNNPQPVAIACGGATATLIASISGNTQGRNYTWSTGATGTNTVSQQVNTPGTYSVTVTNNSQCSATASIQVVYSSGVNNTVSFNPPADVANTPGLQVCPNVEQTFVNTSSRLNGWSSLWTFGNGNTYTLQDGKETFTQGQYTVTLQMDSAGCTFTSAPLTVNVLSAAACVTGINEVDFSNDITLMPNPTTGNITINVSGIEKNLSIRVYNILGSEVYNFNTSDVATTMNKSIDLSNLNSGTYLVKVQTGSKVAVKRVTVSK